MIPVDLARRIIFLQRFRYKILYVKTTLNPADVFSGQDGDTAPEGCYPSFAEGNFLGEAIQSTKTRQNGEILWRAPSSNGEASDGRRTASSAGRRSKTRREGNRRVG